MGWDGGEDILDYSATNPSGDFEIGLNVSNANITKVIGSGSAKDKLVGLPYNNTWTIDGANAGKVSSREIVERSFDKHASVDHAANLVTFGDYAHEFDTGDKVRYSSDLSNDASGLKNGDYYYVVTSDPFSLKLSETYAEAVSTNEEEWSDCHEELAD